jgi:hypothetical protein
MFPKIKTTIKYIAIGFLCIICLILFIVVLKDFKPNYCIEDGDCYEGDTIFDGDIGKEIVITKEYCLENNYEWNEKYKMCKISGNNFGDIDFCLDRGGCWDYIRKRCEMNDQGYCERNEQDCIERKGAWDEEKKYCQLEDK